MITELPLSSPFFRAKVERFLESNGLRMEALDAFYAIETDDGELLAGAGIQKDIVKCVAVTASARSEGLLAPLLSYLVVQAAERGILNLKVFTKPAYQAIFESLGFHLLARAQEAILLENGKGLERYCQYLQPFRRPGRSGVIVMNANPFTLGHKYLIDKASEQVDTLFVIPVKEDVSLFSYSERQAMIQTALADSSGTAPAKLKAPVLPSSDRMADSSGNTSTSCKAGAAVMVLEGSDYVISAATFPTYFFKDLSAVAQTQMQLDLDLYERWIAPALGVSVRFVGSEPFDALTNQYNQQIPDAVVIPRIDGISASKVRRALEAGSFREAAKLCPPTTWPYLLSALAQRALQLELDTPLKPGLVGPDGPGAHQDMDYGVMHAGIAALRPYWSRMALAGSAEELRQLGIEAESAMLAATRGVNTHRGAIFCIGLALNAVCQSLSAGQQVADLESLIQNRVHMAVHRIYSKSLTDSRLRARPIDVKDALRMADGGYRELFEDWLPFYRQSSRAEAPAQPSALARQKTLLRISSTLDDTCILKRAGSERAQKVKEEAEELLRNFNEEKLKELCRQYAREGISPGGAADMLALTIFIDSII